MSKRRNRGYNDVDLSSAKIGFIGAGKMTEAIIKGLVHYGKIEPSKIHVAAPTTKNLEKLKQQFGDIHVTKRNIDVFARYDCDIIFICVYGAVIRNCYKMGGTRPHPLTVNFIPNMKHPIYVISLVSGYDLKSIKKVLLNPEHPEKYLLEMHRAVLNPACAYGLGLCAIDVEPDSNRLATPLRTLLSSIAKLEYIPESQMDASCAVCGSGLAFSYYFINALADGAVKMGLSRQMAVKMAAKTLQCAGQSLVESGKHPNELRDEVCSPSGAGIYGIHALDKADVSSGVQMAIEAAHKRAEELAKSDNA